MKKLIYVTFFGINSALGMEQSKPKPVNIPTSPQVELYNELRAIYGPLSESIEQPCTPWRALVPQKIYIGNTPYEMQQPCTYRHPVDFYLFVDALERIPDGSRYSIETFKQILDNIQFDSIYYPLSAYALARLYLLEGNVKEARYVLRSLETHRPNWHPDYQIKTQLDDTVFAYNCQANGLWFKHHAHMLQ